MNTARPLYNHAAERQCSQIWESGWDLKLLCWTGIHIIGDLVEETPVLALLLCIMSPPVGLRARNISHGLAIDIFECHITDFTISVPLCISKRLSLKQKKQPCVIYLSVPSGRYSCTVVGYIYELQTLTSAAHQFIVRCIFIRKCNKRKI